MAKTDLGAAIAAANEGVEFDTTGDEPVEAGLEALPTPEASSEGAQSQLESEAVVEASSETPPEGDATPKGESTDELPDHYFEVQRGDLPAEEWAVVYAGLKERDEQIQKLMRGKQGTDGETPPEVNEPEEVPVEQPTAMSDEDILAALGLESDNPFDETAAKVAIPLVKALQVLEGQVNGLVEERELAALSQHWETSLDKLEAEHGELPVARLDVLEFAAREGIFDPDDAYWRVAGPANRQADRLLAEARARVKQPKAVEKSDVSSSRPKGAAATGDPEHRGQGLGKAVTATVADVLRKAGLGDD